MKLTKENKVRFALYFFLLLTVAACRHITEGQLLTGRWQYIKVLNNDTLLFDIADTDHLELKADSTFHYEIASAGMVCNGRWEYRDHRLALHYHQPDTTRLFDVEIISARDLIFNEGSKRFVLKRFQ